jgi:uncharacterized protein (TIGR04141 family)
LDRDYTNRLRTKTASGVFLFRVERRIFAITFGFGRSLLKPDVSEKRFGLKVVLNRIGDNKLRTVDRKNFDTMQTHTITQMNRECEIADFGLDLRQILLRAVTGKPEDKDFASRFSGADGLNINCVVSLPTLIEKCRRIFEAYLSEEYRERFPGVDSINEIKDGILLTTLNNELIDRLKGGDTENVYFAVPEFLELTEIEGFSFKRTDDPKPDLYVDDFIATLRDIDSIDIDILKRRRVWVTYASSDFVEDRWRVFDCLNCELLYNGSNYILSEGKWYEIETSFVSSVNRDIASIPISRVAFVAAINEKEPDFLKRIQIEDADNLALCDQKKIYFGGGHSVIEFCDIFSSNREIIHFKRYSGSSVLSHLFSQGVVSATAFASDSVFRKEVNRILPKSHSIPEADIALNPRDFEIVFGIISKNSVGLPGSLPFFSKVALLAAKREIVNILKFRISIARVRTTGNLGNNSHKEEVIP